MSAGPPGRPAAVDNLVVLSLVAFCVSHALPGIFAPQFTATIRVATMMLSFGAPGLLFAAGFLATRGEPTDARRLRAWLPRVLGPYLVASLVVLAIGLWHAPTAQQLLFRLATGSALGIYFLVPVLVCCLLTVPIVSRLGNASLFGLIVALAGYAWRASQDPSWRLTHGLFWNARDVLLQFHLVHFLLGVLAARELPTLRRLYVRAAPIGVTASLLAIASFAWIAVHDSLWPWAPFAHIPYLLGVVALIAIVTPHEGAPAPVRFLGEAAVTVYLYHQLLYPAVGPALRAALPIELAAVAMAALGLAFGAVVAWTGRILLGERSRLVLGT